MTYKCVICDEWHAVTSIVTFNGQEIRQCPNIEKYFLNAESVMIDPNVIASAHQRLNSRPAPQAHDAALNADDVVMYDGAIPDFGEPKKFL